MYRQFLKAKRQARQNRITSLTHRPIVIKLCQCVISSLIIVRMYKHTDVCR